MEKATLPAKSFCNAYTVLKDVLDAQRQFQNRQKTFCIRHKLYEEHPWMTSGNTLIWRCSVCIQEIPKGAKAFPKDFLSIQESEIIQKNQLAIDRLVNSVSTVRKDFEAIGAAFNKVREVTSHNFTPSLSQFKSLQKFGQLMGLLQSQFERFSHFLCKEYNGTCSSERNLYQKEEIYKKLKGLEEYFKAEKVRIINELVDELKSSPSELRNCFENISEVIRKLTSGTNLLNASKPLILCICIGHLERETSMDNISVPNPAKRPMINLSSEKNVLQSDSRSSSPQLEQRLQPTCQAHNEEIASLRKKLSTFQKDAQADTNTILQLEDHNRKLVDVLQKDSEQMKSLQMQYESIIAQNSQVCKLIEKIQGKNDLSLYDKTKELVKLNERLASERVELQATVAVISRENKQFSSRMEQMRSQLSEKNTLLTGQYQQSLNTIKVQDTTIANIQNKLDRTEQQLKAQTKDMEESLKNARKTEEELRKALKSNGSYQKLIEAQKKELLEKLKVCELNLSVAENRCNQQSLEASHARIQLQREQKECETLRKQVKENKQKFSLQTMEYINRNQRLEQDIIRRREQANSKQQINAQLEAVENTARKELENAVKSIQSLTHQTTQQRESIEKLQACINKLQEKYSKVNSAIKQLLQALLRVAQGVRYSSKEVKELQKLLVWSVRELTDEEFGTFVEKIYVVKRVVEQIIKHYAQAFNKSALLEKDVNSLRSNSDQQKQQLLQRQRLETMNIHLKSEIDHNKIMIKRLFDCLELSESRERLSALRGTQLATALIQTVQRATHIYEVLLLIDAYKESHNPSQPALILFSDILADRDLRLEQFVVAAQQVLERECIAKESLQHQTAPQLPPPPTLVPQTSAALESFWSKLLTSQQKKWLLQQLAQQFKCEVISLEQKFIASQHRFDCASYHRVCDQLCNLLTIIQTKKGPVLGGFTDLPLGDKSAPSVCSFIFTVNRKLVMPLKPTRIATLNEYAYGPIFGSENDIRIDKDTVSTNYHVLNSTYQRVEVPGVSNKEVLMGSTLEDVAEYEVFEVVFKNEKGE